MDIVRLLSLLAGVVLPILNGTLKEPLPELALEATDGRLPADFGVP